MTSSNLEFPLHTSLNGVSSIINGKVNDYAIEQYVRYPESLDGVTNKAVEDAIENRKKEKVIERFYRSFYAEYDKLEGKISSNVTAFVSSLFDK